MITIAVDAMGGDFAPEAAVGGAAQVSREPDSPHVLLVGDEERMRSLLRGLEHDPTKLSLQHARTAIPMDADPNDALERFPDAALPLAARVVADGEAEALVSAGLTLLSPAVKRLRAVTDWEQYGGAPVLGFDRVVIKAHGRSTERALANAIKVAHKAVRTGLVDAIRAGLDEARSAGERSPPGGRER